MEENKIVEYVANLARINITEKEKEFLGRQLLRILEYIDKLEELDVSFVEPMRGLHVERNVFREDKKAAFAYREDILNNAPLTEEGYFKIPKVIE